MGTGTMIYYGPFNEDRDRVPVQHLLAYGPMSIRRRRTGDSKSTPIPVVGFVDMAAEPPPHLPPEPGRSHEEQELSLIHI